MEALRPEQGIPLSRGAPKTAEQEEIGQRVDDLFRDSDLEIVRILSQYLRHRGNSCGG